MRVQLTAKAWEDYLYWQVRDKQQLKRIHQLIKDIGRDAYRGIGRPERLKHELSGLWSRRIDQEHRLVYRVKDEVIILYSCRLHYDP